MQRHARDRARQGWHGCCSRRVWSRNRSDRSSVECGGKSIGCCCLFRNIEARDKTKGLGMYTATASERCSIVPFIPYRAGHVVRASAFFRPRRRLLIPATDSAVSRGVDASVPVRLLVYSQHFSSTLLRDLFFTTPRNCLKTLYFVSHGGRAPACCCTVGAARWQRVQCCEGGNGDDLDTPGPEE